MTSRVEARKRRLSSSSRRRTVNSANTGTSSTDDVRPTPGSVKTSPSLYTFLSIMCMSPQRRYVKRTVLCIHSIYFIVSVLGLELSRSVGRRHVILTLFNKEMF